MLKPTVGALPGSEWRLRRTSPRRQWCKGDRTSRYPSLLLSPFLGEESLHSWESGSLFAVLNGGVCVCVCVYYVSIWGSFLILLPPFAPSQFLLLAWGGSLVPRHFPPGAVKCLRSFRSLWMLKVFRTRSRKGRWINRDLGLGRFTDSASLARS